MLINTGENSLHSSGSLRRGAFGQEKYLLSIIFSASFHITSLRKETVASTVAIQRGQLPFSIRSQWRVSVNHCQDRWLNVFSLSVWDSVVIVSFRCIKQWHKDLLLRVWKFSVFKGFICLSFKCCWQHLVSISLTVFCYLFHSFLPVTQPNSFVVSTLYRQLSLSDR